MFTGRVHNPTGYKCLHVIKMANLCAFLKTHSSPRSFFIFSYLFLFFCPYFISVLFCSRSRSSSRRRWPTTIVSLFRDFLLRKWNLMLWLNIARARVICLFFPQRAEEEEEEDGRWECFYYGFMRRDFGLIGGDHCVP